MSSGRACTILQCNHRQVRGPSTWIEHCLEDNYNVMNQTLDGFTCLRWITQYQKLRRQQSLLHVHSYPYVQ